MWYQRRGKKLSLVVDLRGNTAQNVKGTDNVVLGLNVDTPDITPWAPKIHSRALGCKFHGYDKPTCRVITLHANIPMKRVETAAVNRAEGCLGSWAHCTSFAAPTKEFFPIHIGKIRLSVLPASREDPKFTENFSAH